MGNSHFQKSRRHVRRRLRGGMPTRKPQKRKLGELGSKSTKRVSLGDHSEQVYLPAQMKWVDIAEWVQSDEHFCLNIAPFFVDTFDGFRTNCIGVSSMDYFPAMKVCNLGESQVLDPKAPTTLVYLVSLVFGRLCVRSAPEITQAPKFAYLANFEVIKAINALKIVWIETMGLFACLPLALYTVVKKLGAIF